MFVEGSVASDLLGFFLPFSPRLIIALIISKISVKKF